MNLGNPIILKVISAESFENYRLGVRVMVSGSLPFYINRIVDAIFRITWAKNK